MLLESQKHFRDYEIRSEVSKDGRKVKAVRVYVGDFYRLDTDKNGWLKIKVEFSAMYLVAMASCVFALLLNITANKTAWMAIVPICTMLLFCYGLRGLIYLITSEQNMTEYCYEQVKECIGTSSYFLVWTTGASAIIGVCGAGWFGFHGESIGLWIIYLFLHVISFIFSWFIQCRSKSLDFIYIEGERTKMEIRQGANDTEDNLNR